jgi:hypothetical protein
MFHRSAASQGEAPGRIMKENIGLRRLKFIVA